MAVAKLGIRVSLDASDFKGPRLLIWTCKRPLINEKCLSLLQADLDCSGKETVDAVRDADGKSARIIYTRMDSDGESKHVNLQANSVFWTDLKDAQDTEDPVKYLEDNDYKVDVAHNTCFIDLQAVLVEVTGVAAAAPPPGGRKRQRNHCNTSSDEEDSSGASGQGKTAKNRVESQSKGSRNTGKPLADWIGKAAASFVPQDVKTGKYILGLDSDEEQKGVHLWLPKSSTADASTSAGGDRDFMKSYGALRAIQDLLTKSVDAICGESPSVITTRVRKHLRNTNQRIRIGTLNGDGLVQRKQFAQTWYKNWYKHYKSGNRPENWPSTLAEANGNANSGRVAAISGMKNVAEGKDDADVSTGGFGKGSDNTEGGEGSGKKSKLREGYAMPRRESKQPKKREAAAKKAKNSDGEGGEVGKAAEEEAPRRGGRARRPTRARGEGASDAIDEEEEC